MSEPTTIAAARSSGTSNLEPTDPEPEPIKPLSSYSPAQRRLILSLWAAEDAANARRAAEQRARDATSRPLSMAA